MTQIPSSFIELLKYIFHMMYIIHATVVTMQGCAPCPGLGPTP